MNLSAFGNLTTSTLFAAPKSRTSCNALGFRRSKNKIEMHPKWKETEQVISALRLHHIQTVNTQAYSQG